MITIKVACFIGVLVSVAMSVKAEQPDTTAAAAVNGISDEELILDEETVAPRPAGSERRSSVPAAVSSEPTADTAAAAASPQSSTTPPPRDTAKKKIVDEELILDGGAEDLLGQEKVRAQTPIKPSGAAAIDSNAGAVAAQKDDTASAEGGIVRGDRRPLTSSQPVAATPAPVTIERPHSINFAKNLKEYRSPKMAMLMSLIVPGAGQVYTRSSLWAAAFVAVEAAVIGAGWTFVRKAREEKKKARSYADSLYSPDKFKSYCETLATYLKNKYPKKEVADSVFYSIFYDTGNVSFLAEAQKGPGNRSDDFYNELTSGQSRPYIRGWDDVKPDFGTGGFPHGDPVWGVDDSGGGYIAYPKNDSINRGYGFSDFQVKYSDMVAESHRLSRVGSQIYLSILVNHLVSAVAAGIAAKRHNDELLRKESFWQHIDIERKYVNTGSETIPGYALAVRF